MIKLSPMKFPDSRLMTLALMLAISPALAVPVPSSKAPAPAPEAVNTPDSLMAAAHAAQGRGETELALRLAQSAIVADPARPDTYDALGDIYAASGQPDFARNYYSEALSVDPTDPAAIHAIAALDRTGDRRAANAASTDGTKTGTP
jgi:Flp pilus assembly protein TadD